MRKILLTILFLCCMLPAAMGETITMTFVGDCTLGCDSDWFNDERSFVKVIEREGMDYPFALVRDVFFADDLTVINFEGVLADSNRYLWEGRKYNFRGPTSYTEIMHKAGIELATLGNNHCTDFGEPGFANTKKVLAESGIGYARAEEYYIFEKNSIRIGFISYISNVYERNLKKLPEYVSMLKNEEGCAAVVLCIHAGEEYSFRHASTQRTYARKAIDAGIDLVIGHHPHVLQGVSIYKNRNVVYSLGNFSFGGNRRIAKEHYHSMAVQVEMSFEDGKYVGQQMTILPAINTGTLDTNNYQPYWATGTLAEEVIALVQKDSDYTLAPYVEGQGARQEYLPAE